MSNFANVKVPIGTQNMTHLDLSFDHVSTADFMRLQPIGYVHMLPGQSIDLNSVINVRPAPMAVPTYGRIRANIRYFFVPYRQVFPKWESFKQDVISSNLTNSAIPVYPCYFDSDDIVNFITLPLVSAVGTSTDYDFEINGSYYKLTRLGRYLYKIFYSLGYDYIGSDKDKVLQFNGLALLAWAKLFIDWYANSQYLDAADLLAVNQLIEYNDPSNALHLSGNDIFKVLNLAYVVNYQSNPYFEDAWDKPYSPSDNQFTAYTLNDLNNLSTNKVMITSTGYPQMVQSTPSSIDIGSAYLHSALDRLTAYMQQHAISGAREIDRFLSEAGFTSDYLRCMRSIYCGSHIVDIGIGDVYATANSSNAAGTSDLGDYAGRGFGAGEKPCSFKSDEAGIFIAALSIHPSGGYYQGYDRHNRHLDKLDFYTGRLDGLGPQVVEKGEVYVSRNSGYCGPSDYSRMFGYVKRYGEYARSINRVSGDIALPRLMAGGDSWHLMREFDDTSFLGGIAGQVHSVNFAAGVDNYKYNRIFNYQYDDYDCFFVFAHFSVSSYSPIKPLFDVFEFDDEARKSITINVNGSKVN